LQRDKYLQQDYISVREDLFDALQVFCKRLWHDYHLLSVWLCGLTVGSRGKLIARLVSSVSGLLAHKI